MATMGLEGGASRFPRKRVRCKAPGCTTVTQSRRGYCPAHTWLSREAAAALLPDDPCTARAGQASEVELEAVERRQAAAAAFRQRLEAGDYRGLFGERLGELMAQAAADGGVTDELAVLRIVMARLLAEEEDPVTLAKAVSRVAAVSIQAARAQRAINGQLAEGLTDALTTILADLEAGSGVG
ncbi:MAG: hypothetical protein U0Z70_14180 [Thermomicrobiales bacterium]